MGLTRVKMVWLPGHESITENMNVDELVKLATRKDNIIYWSFNTARH